MDTIGIDTRQNRFSLLILVASPSLEEPLVDWLLECEAEYGFSSFPIRGHSSRQEKLTLAEQVSGRKEYVRFEIHLPEEAGPPFIEQLRCDFTGAGIHYWLSPVLEHGRI